MRSKNQQRVRSLTLSAVLAAAYVTLAIICDSVGLLKYAIQIRIPEALCVLAAFTPAAIPGVTVGCLITNILLAGAPLDIVFGTVATFIGVWLGRMLCKGREPTAFRLILCTVPTLISNTLIMPPVIVYSYGTTLAMPIVYVTVFVGELISACVIGFFLGTALKKVRLRFE